MHEVVSYLALGCDTIGCPWKRVLDHCESTCPYNIVSK